MGYGAGLPGYGAGRGTGYGAGAGGRYGAGTGAGYGAGLASGAAAPTLSYASPQSWTYGAAISTLSPTTTGATSFAVQSGALPTGVSLNTSTGDITGTPTAWAASGSVTIRATGAGGTADSTISWTMAFVASTFGTVKRYGYVPNLTGLWTDSARTTHVAVDGDPIGAYDDTSGGGFHLLQATSSSRPTYVANQKNGLGVARFDGVDDFIASAGLSQAQPLTLFVVFKFTSNQSAAAKYVVAGENAGLLAALYEQVTTPGLYSVYAGSAEVGGGTADTNFHYATITVNGASTTLRIDGVDVTPGSHNPGANGFSKYALGGSADGTSLKDCDVGEDMLFDGVISGAELASIESYLAARWAI